MQLPKQDHPPILRPGIHLMTLDTFRDTFSSPATAENPRLRMVSLFEQWVWRLRQLNVSATAWIDGSFVTRKPNPGDIDCVLWNPAFTGPVSEEGKIEVRAMTGRVLARSQYGVDVYIVVDEGDAKMSKQAYWRGLFGFQHDGKHAKGFVELNI